MVILKTLVGNLSANVNEITFTDNIIDGNSIIEVYYNSNDIYTVETWQREHTIGIVTSDHDFPVSVKVLINNVVAFSPYDDSQVLSQLSDLDDRVTNAEDAISGLATRVGNTEDDIEALETNKQDVLIAGDNITIENNVISASGGGGLFDIVPITTETFTPTLVSNTNNLVKTLIVADVGMYMVSFHDTYRRANNRSYFSVSVDSGDAIIFNGSNDTSYLDTIGDPNGHSSFNRTVFFKTLVPNADVRFYLWGNGYSPNECVVRLCKYVEPS